MKFSCERCGKKYATAENPAPGRVYKLRCKACGHLIVVKASSSAQVESHASTSAGGTPADPPSISFEIDPPEAAPPLLGAGTAKPLASSAAIVDTSASRPWRIASSTVSPSEMRSEKSR